MTHMWWAPINDKICIKILVTLVLLTELVSSSPKRPTREYLKMRIEERIKYQGYPCDVHEITTPDGYNLYLYRVPYGVNPTKNFECDGEYININTNKEYVNDEYDEEYSQEERENKEYYDETTGFVEEKELANSTEIPVTRELTTSSTITTFKADTTRSYLSTARTTSPTISSLLQKPSTTVKRLTTTTVTSTTAAVTNPPTTTASISETTAGTSFSIDSTTTRASNAKTLEPITTSKPTENSTRKTFIQKIPKRPWRKPKRSNREPKEFRQNLVNNEKPSEKSVILLLHGMTGSPSNFIHNGKDGLAFYFADRGFDVWILCFRGNNCGQKKLHVKYDSDRDSEFWDFTFHHMASIDVPTAIDYILPKTNQSALHLIGHSAGTIIQILFLSERPEYASKVKIGSHYAGSVFTGMSDYPVLQLSSSLVNILKGVRKFFGWITVLPAEVFDMFMGFLVETCYSDQYFHVCEAMNSIVGSHKSVLVDKYASIPLLFHDSQMHLSHREVFHFMEMFATGECIKYNYGKKRNLREYGQETPPLYNFSRVINPIILHYSSADHFGNLADLKRAVPLLPNVIQVYKVPFWRFTHTDYILGKNASKLVYENTCQMFKRYDRGERWKRLTKVDIDEPLFW